MGKRKPWPLASWRFEGEFIEAVVKKPRPGPQFDNSWETFTKYCDMQEKFAREDGADGIADQIRNARIKAGGRT